jgi:hypothetical protein
MTVAAIRDLARLGQGPASEQVWGSASTYQPAERGRAFRNPREARGTNRPVGDGPARPRARDGSCWLMSSVRDRAGWLILNPMENVHAT